MLKLSSAAGSILHDGNAIPNRSLDMDIVMLRIEEHRKRMMEDIAYISYVPIAEEGGSLDQLAKLHVLPQNEGVDQLNVQ